MALGVLLVVAALGAGLLGTGLLGTGLLGAGIATAEQPPAPAVAEATGSLLGAATGDDDLGGVARDQGVPVPEVPPCLPPIRACVDLGAGHAWLLDNGRVVRGPVDIVPGAPEDPTPRGVFSVQWKAQTYTSREFLVQMPWAVFFADGGIAFHQGNPATFSRGCVKLSEDDARAFFGFLQVGDGVQVV